MKDSSLTKIETSEFDDSLIREKMTRVASVILRNGRAQSPKEASTRLMAYDKLMRINSSGNGELNGHARQVTEIIMEAHATGFTAGMTENDQNISADIVRGIGIAFPKQKWLVLDAITDAGGHMDYHAEGIVTGLFEIANIGDTSVEYDCDLFSCISKGSLLFSLTHQHMTNCNGRLSKAIKEFISPAWKKDSDLSYRLTIISVLMARLESYMAEMNVNEEEARFKYFADEYELVHKKPMTCIESLARELCDRLYLESGLRYAMHQITVGSTLNRNKKHEKVEQFVREIHDLIQRTSN